MLLAKVPGQTCEIFSRDYVPPAPGKVKRQAQPVMVYNDDGFWDGIGKVRLDHLQLLHAMQAVQ